MDPSILTRGTIVLFSDFNGGYSLEIWLDSAALAKLGSLIETTSAKRGTLLVHLTNGDVEFRSSDVAFSRIERTAKMSFVIIISPNDLSALFAWFRRAAAAEEDPDYLVHYHLNLTCQVSGETISDAVFSRIDRYHTFEAVMS